MYMTVTNWRKEYNFIVATDHRNPGPDFNNDPACFKRYCMMQGEQAIRDGAATIGNDILKFVKAI